MTIQVERASNGYYVSVLSITGESIITKSGCEALYIIACACGITCTIENGGTKYSCVAKGD